jgi:hypothetical protein
MRPGRQHRIDYVQHQRRLRALARNHCRPPVTGSRRANDAYSWSLSMMQLLRSPSSSSSTTCRFAGAGHVRQTIDRPTDLPMAQHPSHTLAYLLRGLAFACPSAAAAATAILLLQLVMLRGISNFMFNA